MVIRPVELKAANAYIEAYHRHHKKVQGHRFSIAAMDAYHILGVCVVGRPVARKTCQRSILEVTRLCTEGGKNVCSFLYSAAARVGKELGYKKIQTFILDSESGISLKASGWKRGHQSSGKDGWQSRAGRRTDQPTCVKTLWYKDLE